MHAVDLTELPHLAAADLRLLWVNDWYDGPLEAVVEHEGARCLMLLNGPQVDVGQPMQWVIFSLHEEGLVEEEAWHALFEQHVGHHWCFDHEPPPEPEAPRDGQAFFKAYAHRRPRILGEPLGWIDELPPRRDADDVTASP